MPCHANTSLETVLKLWISSFPHESHVPERYRREGILVYANSRVGNAEKHGFFSLFQVSFALCIVFPNCIAAYV